MESLLLAIQFLIAQRFSIQAQECIFNNQHSSDINLVVDNETLIGDIVKLVMTDFRIMMLATIFRYVRDFINVLNRSPTS